MVAQAKAKPWPAEEIHEDPREKHGKLLIEKIEASLASGKPSIPWRTTWDPEMNPRNIRGNMYRGGNLMMTLFARRSIRMLLRAQRSLEVVGLGRPMRRLPTSL